jgi:methylthioribose-1-phosphate isomerase
LKVQGKNFKTIWLDPMDSSKVKIIDQRLLPHEFKVRVLESIDDANDAISQMAVRGAPLIGATAGWGVYLASVEALERNLDIDFVTKKSLELIVSRPTAINLKWAVNRMISKFNFSNNLDELVVNLKKEAQAICDEDEESSIKIGQSGSEIIRDIANKKSGETVNILTHCNAGWLATVDYGTATAPIYAARDEGIDLHVWVDETRPRNQGSSLTAWELGNEGIKHTIVVDNAGGHLMQNGEVDLCLVGSDRTTRAGDVCNKIGTYLKALAAKDNKVPFYVALPESTFDWTIEDGISEIPIETRDEHEIAFVSGKNGNEIKEVRVTPENSKCLNIAFDVTPSHFITGLITPRGLCKADKESIAKLYPGNYK